MASSGIKVNFTDEELSSEARGAEVYAEVPTGEYNATIAKIELGTVKEIGDDGKPNKNAGKHFWKLRARIADGKYEGKIIFDNVMLFQGAGFSLVQLLKATGHGAALKSGDVPPANEVEGKKCVIVVLKAVDKRAMAKAPPGAETQYRNELKGYKAPGGAGSVSSAKKDPLAP